MSEEQSYVPPQRAQSSYMEGEAGGPGSAAGPGSTGGQPTGGLGDAERNKEVVRRVIEAWNNKDYDRLFSYYDENVRHKSRFGEHNLDGVKMSHQYFEQAFQDLHADILYLVAEGDKVVARMHVRSKHAGNFMGIEGTGRTLEWDTIDISTIRNGKIVEHEGIFDEVGLMGQVGAIPTELLTSMA